MLGEEIKKAQAAGDRDTGETYYLHWFATLECIVAEKGATSAQALAQHYQAWERATQRGRMENRLTKAGRLSSVRVGAEFVQLVNNMPWFLPQFSRMDHRSLLDTAKEELPSSRFRRAKVYVDCNSFGPGAIEAAVRLYGAERIVHGTDGTEFGCEWTSKALADARIGEDERKKILHTNAAAMMSRLAKVAQRETVAA